MFKFVFVNTERNEYSSRYLPAQFHMDVSAEAWNEKVCRLSINALLNGTIHMQMCLRLFGRQTSSIFPLTRSYTRCSSVYRTQ